MSIQSVDAAETDISAALDKSFGTKKNTIAEKLAKAGKRLPRGVAEDVAYLDEIRKRTAHPRRRGQVSTSEVQAVRDRNLKKLGKVDVARDKARERINWLGGLVLNLMLFGVLYYFFLNWLGAI